jgi:hypothetical protein
MSQLLDLLLDIHDGDDRCGCLRKIVAVRDKMTDGDVIEALGRCLELHPAGSLYRTLDRSLERTHVRTNERTKEPSSPILGT